VITDAQRAGWEAYALAYGRKNVFGQDLKTSGINEYSACFVLASDIGEVPVEDAPVTSRPVLVVDATFAEGVAAGQIDVSWTADQGGKVDVWITGVLSPGRKAQESAFSHFEYTDDATEARTIGGLVPGGKYGVRARQIFLNGQYGPWVEETLTAKA